MNQTNTIRPQSSKLSTAPSGNERSDSKGPHWQAVEKATNRTLAVAGGTQRLPGSDAFFVRQRCVGVFARVFWLVAVLLSAQPCYATTGVALFVKSFVVIATDGRVNEIGE